MDRKLLLGLALTAGGTIFTCQAQAYSTSLINFPIADILRHREGLYTIGAAGFARNVNKGFNWAQTATVGVLDHAELGWSNDFNGHNVFDAKVQFWDSPKDGLAMSFGITNYDADAHTNDAFFSVRKDFANFRLHAEAYRSDKVVGVFGADFCCGCGWSGAIEHKTGSDSQTWVAFTSPCIKMRGLTATLASRCPWDGGSGPQYQVILNYGFRF